METPADINRQVEEALNSLDGIRRAEPKPFFFNRVWARLQREERSIWESLAGLLSRPAVAFTSMAFLILVNVFVVVSRNHERVDLSASEAPLADQYRFAQSVYEIENVLP